jgi:hypothetical protein
LREDAASLGPQSFGYNQQIVSHEAQIGVSIELIDELRMRTPELNSCTANAMDQSPANSMSLVAVNDNSYTHFIIKTAEHLFNYVASFSRQLPDLGAEQFVPLSSIHAWYNSYLRRLQYNPNFWKEQS